MSRFPAFVRATVAVGALSSWPAAAAPGGWEPPVVLDPGTPLELTRIGTPAIADIAYLGVLFDEPVNSLELARVSLSQEPPTATFVQVATGGGKGRDDWDSTGLVQLTRELAPNILINDRLDLPGSADLLTHPLGVETAALGQVVGKRHGRRRLGVHRDLRCRWCGRWRNRRWCSRPGLGRQRLASRLSRGQRGGRYQGGCDRCGFHRRLCLGLRGRPGERQGQQCGHQGGAGSCAHGVARRSGQDIC